MRRCLYVTSPTSKGQWLNTITSWCNVPYGLFILQQSIISRIYSSTDYCGTYFTVHLDFPNKKQRCTHSPLPLLLQPAHQIRLAMCSMQDWRGWSTHTMYRILQDGSAKIKYGHGEHRWIQFKSQWYSGVTHSASENQDQSHVNWSNDHGWHVLVCSLDVCCTDSKQHSPFCNQENPINSTYWYQHCC